MTRHVLIVDDDPEDVAHLESYLRGKGLEVDAILTEREARKRLAMDPPAILIIDVCAPSIDALGLLQQFRRTGAKDSAAIVAFSGRKPIPERACWGLVDVEAHKPFAYEKAEIYTFVSRILAGCAGAA
jgi:DNA-binding response OmpR family regulator